MLIVFVDWMSQLNLLGYPPIVCLLVKQKWSGRSFNSFLKITLIGTSVSGYQFASTFLYEMVMVIVIVTMMDSFIRFIHRMMEGGLDATDGGRAL